MERQETEARPADTAIDDRGRACAIAELSPRQVGVRALGLPVLYDRDTQRELAVTDRLELAWAIGGGVAGAALWQLAWIIYPLLGLPGLFGGFVVIPVLFAMITWRLALGTVRRRRSHLVLGVYLSTGRCGSCGYALSGLAPESDGCVVCPECGAAWKTARIGTAVLSPSAR